MSEIFVTNDGTWGDAKDLRIFNTDKWTDEQFDEFSNTSDNDRLSLAEEFSKEVCQKCGVEGEGSTAWGGYCHDCDNQSCPTCGEIECEHEF